MRPLRDVAFPWKCRRPESGLARRERRRSVSGMSDGNAERIARLEERLAWFEKHSVEQDRAMLELAEKMDELRAELQRWRDREDGQGGEFSTQERPPHY